MSAPDHAEEYAACRARVRDVLSDADEDVAAVVVPTCPDWTVHDVCAHLVGVPAALVVRDNPPPGGNQAWVDAQVAARAGRRVADLLDEWDEVGPAFETIMRKVPRAFGGLVYDAVAHEHDIRGAIGRPGARDSDGVYASVDVLVGLVEHDLADRGPEPGTVDLAAGGRRWVIGSGAPEVAIDTEPFELMRLLGSRRSRNQVRAAGWRGDVEPFISALAHMPLPEHDIIE